MPLTPDTFVGPPAPRPPIVAHLARLKEKNAPLHPLLEAAPIAANFYDALATRYALNRGGEEANPVLAPFADNSAALIGTKLGVGVLSTIAARKLAKSGHRNWAKALTSLTTGIPASAGTYNLIAAQRR